MLPAALVGRPALPADEGDARWDPACLQHPRTSPTALSWTEEQSPGPCGTARRRVEAGTASSLLRLGLSAVAVQLASGLEAQEVWFSLRGSRSMVSECP